MNKSKEPLGFEFRKSINRLSPKARIWVFLVTIVVCTFLYIKFFKIRRDSLLMTKVFKFINDEMDRILTYKTREKQNDEFRAIVSNFPITPVRMTLTTAVFKYSIDERDKGRSEQERKHVILKRVIWNKQNMLNEDFMSNELSHPNLIKTLKTFRTRRCLPSGEEQTLLWIFAEFLDVKVTQKSVNGDEKVIRDIMECVLKGLAYMHERNIAHLDLKIGNIMGETMKDKSVVYKLIDFGYSQKMPESGSTYIEKKNYGTYPYKPPEIVFSNIHGLKSDIWSLGAVCWFLSLKYTPFYIDTTNAKDFARYKKFLKPFKNTPEDSNNHRFIFDRNTSKVLRKFVKDCMNVDPEKRPTAQELLRHPFIAGNYEMPLPSESDDIIDSDSMSTTSQIY